MALTPVTSLLNNLGLDRVLTERVRVVSTATTVDLSNPNFILYLPTVNLRTQHNPAFSLACHFANQFQVPLLVLCTVLDDAHHNLSARDEAADEETFPIVGTARRLCFQLQLLQKVCAEWQNHGCSVAIRVHGPSCRRPHHLTLARQSAITITDEPFVHPYRNYVQSVAKASKVCFCVDGSTTVPPLAKLRPLPDGSFDGVPPKAWMWRKKMEGDLQRNVRAVVDQGVFDAPPLRDECRAKNLSWKLPQHPLYSRLPKEWKDVSVAAPGERAWTVDELSAIDPYKWSMKWPGIDTTVAPCRQTDGSKGWERWQKFKRFHLAAYAKNRNNIRLPHAVSRLSCFLNVGAVSIFQIVHELWKDKCHTEKFEDEIIKWREISYAHAFSTPHYFGLAALPDWSRAYLEDCMKRGGQVYSLKDLCLSQTNDSTWNAMQTYLRETGELHNNARMTWGKTALHWQKSLPTSRLLLHMACLNDRYALDGLSPPSYAGLLWCFGWCDKPWSGGAISTKPASGYRTGPEGFAYAQDELLEVPRMSIAEFLRPSSQTSPSDVKDPPQQTTTPKDATSSGTAKNGTKRKRTIDSYFTPAKSK